MSDFRPMPRLDGATRITARGTGRTFSAEELMSMSDEELEAAGVTQGETPDTTVAARDAIKHGAPLEELVELMARDQMAQYVAFRSGEVSDGPSGAGYPQLSFWGSADATMHAILAVPITDDFDKDARTITGGLREMRIVVGEPLHALGATFDGRMWLRGPDDGPSDEPSEDETQECVIALVVLEHDGKVVQATLALPVKLDDDERIVELGDQAPLIIDKGDGNSPAIEHGAPIGKIMSMSFKAIKELEGEGS